MGKKRRYIQRVNKFGRKMFNFLDKLDGTDDEILAHPEIDNLIDRVTVTDRGNGTIFINSRAIGADFTDEKMHYKVNSLAEDTDIDCVTTGTGPDKFTFPSAVPAVDGAGTRIDLTEGGHTVTAELKGGTQNAPLISAKFHVAAVKKDLSAVTAEDDGSGVIKVNVAAGIDLPAAADAGAAGEAAGRLAGEEAFTLGSGGDKNDLLVSLVDKDGNTVEVAAVSGCSSVGDTAVRSTIAKGSSFKFRGKEGALPNAGSPYVLTITPRNVGGTAHAPSAITISQTVA
jgi:hypothetical protein